MVLHGEEWKLAVPHTFDGAVVEVEVGDLERRRARNAIGIANYREAMILRGDENLSRPKIAHRVVPSPVSVGQLGRRAAISEPDELVAKANAEGRESAAGEIAHGLERIVDGSRIARPIRKEETVRT